MTKKRLIYSEDGISTFHYYDHDAKKTIIEQTEDVESLLSINQRRMNDSATGWKGDMHHIASIPRTLYEQWWREFGGNPMNPENRPRLMQKLRDRDFAKLRTKAGSI